MLRGLRWTGALPDWKMVFSLRRAENLAWGLRTACGKLGSLDGERRDWG